MDNTAHDFTPAVAWVAAFVLHGQRNTVATSVAFRGAQAIEARKANYLARTSTWNN